MIGSDWEPKIWAAVGPEEYDALLAGLRLHGEASYLDFNRRIIPGLGEAYGVRMPFLRKVAVSLGRNPRREEFWDKLWAGESFEERILAAMLLPTVRPVEFGPKYERILRFLPRINNWAVCDTAAGASGEWVRREDTIIWECLTDMVSSPNVWTRRFGVVLMLHLQKPGDFDRARNIFHRLRVEREYYVLMGMAWVASYYYFVEPDKLTAWLRDFPNDEAVNLTVRKIVESRKADRSLKNAIKAYKRAKTN